MRESKASSVVVCLHHAGERRHFRLGVSSSVGHCCQYFWVGWGPNRIKGGLRSGKCQRDIKQALQIFLGRLQLDDADVVVYKGSKTPRPCCRAVERACFGCARSVALVTSINMAGGACSSLSFCCRELICDSEVRASRACPSKPPTRTNQLHVNRRDSISGFLQSRFTNNKQKNRTNAVPQQWFGQQRAALPNKLRRYARMHTCNPWPVLEHMAQTHASRLTIFICWAFSSAQVPSRDDNSLFAKARIFLILALPTRESP